MGLGHRDVYECDVPLVVNRQNPCGNVPAYAEMLAANHGFTRVDPDDAESCVALAWILATHPDARLRDGRQAVRVARKALALDSAHEHVLETLAAAYAEAGDYEEAVFWRSESLKRAATDLVRARPAKTSNASSSRL